MPGRGGAWGAALSLLLLTACGTAAPAGAPPSGPASGPAGGTGRLLAALGRVADTDATREVFEYSEVAALAGLPGQEWDRVRFSGARFSSPLLARQAGLPLDAATYAISAGREPAHVIVFAGGQEPAAVAAGMRRLGWSEKAGTWTAPPLATTPAPSTDGGVPHGHARQHGTDLILGGETADLTGGTPAAGVPTLAARPAVAALVACLGDVVAAAGRFRPGAGYLGTAATGVRMPAAPDAKAKVALCVADPSDAEAAKTAETLRRELATGKYNGSVPYATQYADATVTVLGGPQHVVRVEATAQQPDLMLSVFHGYGLPGELGQGTV